MGEKCVGGGGWAYWRAGRDGCEGVIRSIAAIGFGVVFASATDAAPTVVCCVDGCMVSFSRSFSSSSDRKWSETNADADAEAVNEEGEGEGETDIDEWTEERKSNPDEYGRGISIVCNECECMVCC